MLILDTGIVLDLMAREPEESVLRWVSTQSAVMLFVTTVTEAEINLRLELAVDLRQRQVLATAVKAMFDDDFDGRVLTFDRAAAAEYARIVASRTRAGRPIPTADAQIAAIAKAKGAALATRTGDYADCGITVVTPWG